VFTDIPTDLPNPPENGIQNFGKFWVYSPRGLCNVEELVKAPLEVNPLRLSVDYLHHEIVSAQV
jgi:hypothetical protein